MLDAHLHLLGSGSQEPRKPLEVIRDFFRERSQEDLRKILNDILYVVLVSDSFQFEKGIDRDDAIHTIRQLLELAEASQTLLNAKGRK